MDIHNPYNIYKYDLYTSTVAFQIKQEEISKLNKIYNSLPIHSKEEISITGIDIANLLSLKPGPYLKNIIQDIEKK